LHWHVVPRYIDDRHFPNPIWGASQRASRRQVAQGWEERLVTHLTKLLARGD
jgi:diadenosine tetraphosphate (Ap4A) HIT family hydrolase